MIEPSEPREDPPSRPIRAGRQRGWIWGGFVLVVAAAIYLATSMVASVTTVAPHSLGRRPTVGQLEVYATVDDDLRGRLSAAAKAAHGVHAHMNHQIWGDRSVDSTGIADAISAAADNLYDCPEVARRFNRLADAVYGEAFVAAHDRASELEDSRELVELCP